MLGVLWFNAQEREDIFVAFLSVTFCRISHEMEHVFVEWPCDDAHHALASIKFRGCLFDSPKMSLNSSETDTPSARPSPLNPQLMETSSNL
jgi:hypothetical protein